MINDVVPYYTFQKFTWYACKTHWPVVIWECGFFCLFLKMADIWACFPSSGSCLVWMDVAKISAKGSAMETETSLRTLGRSLSGPGNLLTLIFFSFFYTIPFVLFMLLSSSSKFNFLKNGISSVSGSLVNTLLKQRPNMSAFSVSFWEYIGLSSVPGLIMSGICDLVFSLDGVYCQNALEFDFALVAIFFSYNLLPLRVSRRTCFFSILYCSFSSSSARSLLILFHSLFFLLCLLRFLLSRALKTFWNIGHWCGLFFLERSQPQPQETILWNTSIFCWHVGDVYWIPDPNRFHLLYHSFFRNCLSDTLLLLLVSGLPKNNSIWILWLNGHYFPVEHLLIYQRPYFLRWWKLGLACLEYLCLFAWSAL